MSFFDGFRYRLRTVLRASSVEREREEEFAFHHSLTEQELLQGAVDADEARHAARRDFGNSTYLKEEIRQMGALRWIDAMRQDLRFGARTLRRSPVFVLVAVLSIGLAIGANTAIFGMIHALLLARLPVPAAHELVQLRRVLPEGTSGFASAGFHGSFFSWEEYDALVQSRAILRSGFAGTYCDDAQANGSGPLSLSVVLTDGAFFQLLGINSAAGRLLTQADHDAARPVAVLSYDFALHHYESATAAVGQTLVLHGAHFTIAGVLPRGFQGLIVGEPSEVMVPHTTFQLFQDRAREQQRPSIRIIARFIPGTTSAAAAIVAAFQNCCSDGQLADDFTPRAAGQRAVLVDISHGMPGDKFDMRTELSRVFLALMSGVALLLLIACSNVGNLLLARALVRGRELAVRRSLGASRGRIVRQLLVESALLAALGAALGLAVALWGTALLARHLPANLRMLEPYVAVPPSLIIFAFAGGVTLACALLFGVLPALRATRLDLITGLRETRPTLTRGRLDRAIVALQVGLALVLATSAGLLVATLRNITSGIRSHDPQHLIIAEVDVQGTTYQNASMLSLQQQLAARLRQISGVRAVGASNVLPTLFMEAGYGRLLDLPGYETASENAVFVNGMAVAPGYFDAMSITLKTGRDFGPEDRLGAPGAIIISENIAKQFFAGRDPIGGIIRFRGDRDEFRIAGVAEDIKYFDLRAPARRTYYVPWAQAERGLGSPIFAIHTETKAAALLPAVRDVINTTVPGINIRRLRTLTESASLGLGREKALAWLATSFGALAILLAAIGLYGVLAFQVSARSHEIGVRMALGADASRVVQMVLRQSLVVVVMGVLAGVPLALVAARTLTSLLYGVPPWHPAPLAGAALVLLLVGVLASLLPSRNAARVDPLVAIRSN